MSEQPSASVAPRIVGSLRLDLEAETLTVFPDEPARALHGALHRAIERIDPVLSSAVHAAPESPLVCSPLYLDRDDGRLEAVERQVVAGERVFARVSVLEREPLLTLVAALDGLRLRGLPVVVERPFQIVSVWTDAPDGDWLPAIATYADLAAVSQPAATVTMRFTSPTYFRQASAILPIPLPRLVFRSYLRRWTTFAGIDLPGVDPAAIVQGVHALGEPEGEVHRTRFRNLGERGFIGTARYRIDGDDAFRRGIATLATYATYCGTGSRTTFGMGQTQRVE